MQTTCKTNFQKLIVKTNNVYKSIIFQLSKIASIRKYITVDIAKTLVTSLILSRLDYCNSLFCNKTNENIEKQAITE